MVIVIVIDFLAFVMHTHKIESQEYHIFGIKFRCKIRVCGYTFLSVEKARNCLPFNYYELTYLIKYTVAKSKISPLFFDFFIDLDKNEEINNIYVSFKKWLTSPDKETEVKDLIKNYNCFAFHMRWQLNLMYSGWYPEPIYPYIPKDYQELIDEIEQTIETCHQEKRNIREVYKKYKITRL